jgi:hypothetical protein
MEINLDGGEKDIIKAIGLGGTIISGETLIERCGDLEEAELLSALKGLMTMGYIVADRQSFHNFDDIERGEFHINSGYARDLKEALDPRLKAERAGQKSRRVRRE